MSAAANRASRVIGEKHGVLIAEALSPLVALNIEIGRKIRATIGLIRLDLDVLEEQLDRDLRMSIDAHGRSPSPVADRAMALASLVARRDDARESLEEVANALLASDDADEIVAMVKP